MKNNKPTCIFAADSKGQQHNRLVHSSSHNSDVFKNGKPSQLLSKFLKHHHYHPCVCAQYKNKSPFTD